MPKALNAPVKSNAPWLPLACACRVIHTSRWCKALEAGVAPVGNKPREVKAFPLFGGALDTKLRVHWRSGGQGQTKMLPKYPLEQARKRGHRIGLPAITQPFFPTPLWCLQPASIVGLSSHRRPLRKYCDQDCKILLWISVVDVEVLITKPRCSPTELEVSPTSNVDTDRLLPRRLGIRLDNAGDLTSTP